MTKKARTIMRGLGLVASLLCLAAPARAAAPPNDDFDNAIVIGALPFSDFQDAVEATPALDDPPSTCGLVPQYTIWYSFTPTADVSVDASATYVSSIHVYSGSRGSLTQVACGSFQATVRFPAAAGTTYHIMVAVGATPPVPAPVTFTLREVPPPPPPPVNDEIANATVISALPFAESTNTLSATVSPGDPYCYGSAATVWYSFTPTQDLRVEVNASGMPVFPTVSISTGSAGSLIPLACEAYNIPFGARARFDASAGVTYWIMVGSAFGGPGGPLAVSVAVAPPPFSLGLEVHPRGSVVPSTGVATVRGTVTCSEPSFVNVSGSLRQERPGQAIEAFFYTYVMCEGSTAWNATPYYGLGLFRGRAVLLFTGGRGEAQVTASGSGMTTGEYDSDSVTRSVQLSGAK